MTDVKILKVDPLKEEFLDVVTCVFNPSSYVSRYNRYFQFADYISKFKNVRLWTIELAIGDQPFTVTDSNNPFHRQVRSDKALWYKENLLDMLINSLPSDAVNIAWVDCDVQWDQIDWAEKTIAALKKYPVVQMFSTWQNLDEYDKPTSETPVQGFAYRWVKKLQTSKFAGSTGLAWAIRRDVFKNLGGFIDWGILGSGDYYMAHALIGKNKSDVISHVTEGKPDPNTFIGAFDIALNKWIKKADVYVKKNIGYVDLNLKHFFHGKKSERGYNWRWRIPVKYKYSPLKNVSYREDGLIEITGMPPEFFTEVADYFNSRNEDAPHNKDNPQNAIAAE